MSGHRQAAVALHGLAAQDRRAILAELPETDQDILRGLLAELAELGFEHTPGIAAAMAEPAPRAAAQDDGKPDAAMRRTLRHASPAAMLAILGHEPASLQACVLALDSWPWANGFLELLPQPRRMLAAESLRAGIAAAPARSQFLLESVAAKLADMPGTAAAGTPARTEPRLSALARTLHRFAPWTR
ncbi:hypothetical protein [Massilia sp. Leaf139]|uniref:hypothetical protein n=1 Tax=Massilia sp. Leaf139 TaxID=1736272 RepID=UPI0006FB6441|nr:hypothetical protein [Massilia sp. Leaf139]KQQ96173.1 hypothetical protein ASF77_21970 [Massilia sp. Leaf139]